MKSLIVTVLNKLSFNCPIRFRLNYVLLPQTPSLIELAVGYPFLVEEGFARRVVKRLQFVVKCWSLQADFPRCVEPTLQ